MLIFGTLQTSGGLPVTSGELRFEFVPVGGGSTVRIDAMVGSLSEHFTFVAFVPNERTPVSDPLSALELGSGRTYTPRVYYNGALLTPVQIDSPLTSERARIIGPLTYTVSPTGKLISVSHDVDFGYVEVGSLLDRTFSINNVGTETVAGTAQLAGGLHYKVMVGAVSVPLVAINLDPGQSMDVTVRFEPTILSDLLTDTLQVRTDGGNEDRQVSGNSAGSAVEPNPDINGDGEVNELDIFMLLRNWQLRMPGMPNPEADLDSDRDADAQDLLRFLEVWHNSTSAN
jgi:hypothetical protein